MIRDDMVRAPTRITAGIIVVVLIAAVLILYGQPGQTERLWAWPITPEMTALVMGAGYASGAYFFARVLVARSWRAVALGFLPITGFTTFMLIATVLHWDRFTHGHPSFYAWTLLYVVTPFLVPALWWMNRRRDPGRLPDDVLLPRGIRAALAMVGAGVVALAVVMMATPDAVTGWWPWQLSPLTARVMSSYLVLTGGSLLAIAVDARWRAAKVLTETLVLGSALILVATVRDWGSLVSSPTVRLIAVGTWIAVPALLTLLYVWMGARPRAGARPSPSHT